MGGRLCSRSALGRSACPCAQAVGTTNLEVLRTWSGKLQLEPALAPVQRNQDFLWTLFARPDAQKCREMTYSSSMIHPLGMQYTDTTSTASGVSRALHLCAYQGYDSMAPPCSRPLRRRLPLSGLPMPPAASASCWLCGRAVIISILTLRHACSTT